MSDDCIHKKADAQFLYTIFGKRKLRIIKTDWQLGEAWNKDEEKRRNRKQGRRNQNQADVMNP